jgi:Pectate lyase superfamily protein
MSDTIPPDTRVAGSTGHIADHNNLADMMTLVTQYNVMNTAYGSADPTGTTDSYAALQAALTAARVAGGGTVVVPPGVYLTSGMLQIGSNTTLLGVPGATTIRAKSGSWASVAQPGVLNGLGVIITYNDAAASNICLEGIIFDGNEAGITAIPSWASAICCGSIHVNFVTGLTIRDCQSINSLGYSVYLQSCTQFGVFNNTVLSGQVNTWGLAGTPSQQDGIHIDSCTYGKIDGNYVDTGTYTTDVGDDAIAFQSYAVIHDITVSNNVIRAGEAGIDLALTSANIYNIVISGNTVWSSQSWGIVSQPFAGSGNWSYNITISGNTLMNTGLSNGAAGGIALLDYSTIATPAKAWQNVVIKGNTIYNGTATASASLIYCGYGDHLTIADNIITNSTGSLGIQVGGNVGANSGIVTDFTISGNVVDMSASTNVSDIEAICIIDSQNGSVTGNTCIGPGAAAFFTAAVDLASYNVAITGVNVTGNRCHNWNSSGGGYVVGEYNNGALPDYNNFAGNLLHGCGSTPYGILGTHTSCQMNPIDLAVIQSTEAFIYQGSTYTTSSGTGTGLQKLFNESTNGTLTLPVGVYFFECEFSLTAMSSTSGTFSFGVGGSATLSSIKYTSTAQKSAAVGTLATWPSLVGTSAAATALVAASTTTTGAALIRGAISVSVAGTIIPEFAVSQAANVVVGALSYFRVWPAGPVGSPGWVNGYFGTWS